MAARFSKIDPDNLTGKDDPDNLTGKDDPDNLTGEERSRSPSIKITKKMAKNLSCVIICLRCDHDCVPYVPNSPLQKYSCLDKYVYCLFLP